MELASGPNVSAVQAGARCLTRQGLRFCIDPPPPAHGGFVPGHELDLLTAELTVPNRITRDQVEIGLASTGVTALQILDSMKPIAK